MNHPQYHLFLAGVGRSGTTALRRGLGLHPQIYYEGKENNVVQDVLEAARENCRRPSRIAAMCIPQAEYDQAFHRLITDLVWPDSTQRAAPVWLAAINPPGPLLDYLVQVFPQARVLGLVRNGIEVVCSRMAYDSFAQFPFEAHCQTWLRTEGVVDWGERNPERFRLFRHEWMYQPERLRVELQQLFGWLGLADSDAVAKRFLERVDHPTGAPPESQGDWTSDQRAAYFSRKSQGWRDWTSEQRASFRTMCQSLMDRFGYELPF